jgi:hypothetical protein
VDDDDDELCGRKRRNNVGADEMYKWAVMYRAGGGVDCAGGGVRER